jgi:hypothetical protein
VGLMPPPSAKLACTRRRPLAGMKAADMLACRQRPCLTGFDGRRQLGGTVSFDEVEHREARSAGIDPEIADNQANATVAKRCYRFQQVVHRAAR